MSKVKTLRVAKHPKSKPLWERKLNEKYEKLYEEMDRFRRCTIIITPFGSGLSSDS